VSDRILRFPDRTWDELEGLPQPLRNAAHRANAKTCLGSVHQHGTYKIFGGTGAYQGISGHGRYHLDNLFVAARNANGTCSHSKEPVGFQLVVQASGPVQR
jgi:hypothetical protein